MERTIGNLGQEIRLHSNPYANLTRRGVARCIANTIFAKFPTLWGGTPDLPRNAIPLTGDYVLLHPREDTPSTMREDEFIALKKYTALDPELIPSQDISRYGRLQLPNSHRVRCAWKEDERKKELRISRMVKVSSSLVFIQ